MPLAPDQFPDSAVHRMCVRCHRWCWPNEGADYALPRVSPFAAAATVAGIAGPAHFMCFGCRRKRVALRVWILSVLAVLIAMALIYRQFTST